MSTGTIAIPLNEPYAEKYQKVSPKTQVHMQQALQLFAQGLLDSSPQTLMKLMEFLGNDAQNKGRALDILSKLCQPPSPPEDYSNRIVETDRGPTLSGTKTTVYDVMVAYEEQADFFFVCYSLDLLPDQVELALAYIEEHRAKLEPELEEIQTKLAEQESYYRKLEEKRKRESPPLPMTPLRKSVYEIIDKNRRARGELVPDRTKYYSNGLYN
ncbi:MAG: hypothetical protein AAF639_06525, partial [Chloroflexota bacterium]